MFVADAKTLARIAPALNRVVVADPNPASGRLLIDIMKSMGARQVVAEPNGTRVLEAIREIEPGVVFLERSGPTLDGEALTRKLRRSNLNSRRVPVIMVTADATATTIKGARDAGVHEFLRKPFTATDLFRRIENVALKPRDWVEAVGYVGPDRRRFNSGAYTGPQKRQDDCGTEQDDARTTKDQAMRILAAALAQYEADPAQARRAIAHQVEALKGLAIESGDAALAVAVTGLRAVLSQSSARRADLIEPIRSVLALAEPATLRPTG